MEECGVRLPDALCEYLERLDERSAAALIEIPYRYWTSGVGSNRGPAGEIKQCLTAHVYRIRGAPVRGTTALVPAAFDRTCAHHGLYQTVEAVKSFLRNLK